MFRMKNEAILGVYNTRVSVVIHCYAVLCLRTNTMKSSEQG
jgi:hypothetical protein